MGQANVFIKNHKETMAALRKIDPELASQLNKRMNDGARKITSRAKQRVPARPLRNWGAWTRGRDGADLSWNPQVVKKGITYSRAGGRRGSVSGGGSVRGISSFKLVNRSPIGAIYEMAGSKGGGSPQGQVFVKTIQSNFGPEPRLLIETWRSMKGITMMAAIARECAKAAEEAVQKAMPSGN